MFLELNSKRLYQSSGKEKESFCLVFPSTRKRERYNRAVTAKKCKKSVTHVQSCCFANLNLLLKLPNQPPADVGVTNRRPSSDSELISRMEMRLLSRLGSLIKR